MKSIDEKFGFISNKLLNESVLYINDIPHRLVEMEFYLYSDGTPIGTIKMVKEWINFSKQKLM